MKDVLELVPVFTIAHKRDFGPLWLCGGRIEKERIENNR